MVVSANFLCKVYKIDQLRIKEVFLAKYFNDSFVFKLWPPPNNFDFALT